MDTPAALRPATCFVGELYHMPLILGCDPGLSGALALLDGPRLLAVADMPVTETATGARRVDVRGLSGLWARWRAQFGEPAAAVVELVGPSPADSRAGAFQFGHAVGRLETMLTLWLGNRVHYVTPQVWKAAFSLPGGAANKPKSLDLARQEWPDAPPDWFALKKHNGRAEAALIAQWGAVKANFVA
jgi:hypothetical protein